MPRSISAISFSFRFQRRFSGHSHINSSFTLSLYRKILYIHKNVSSLRRNGCRKPWNENENSTNRNMVRFCIRIIMEVFERWWWRLVIGLTDFYFKYITTQWLWSSTHKVWMWMCVCAINLCDFCFEWISSLLKTCVPFFWTQWPCILLVTVAVTLNFFSISSIKGRERKSDKFKCIYRNIINNKR